MEDLGMTRHSAKVVRVSDGGVAYTRDCSTNKFTVFTFGKIAGYRGQTAKELGLRRGKTVTVEYNDDNEVFSVVI